MQMKENCTSLILTSLLISSTLLGCGSRVNDVLIINRFDQPVQVEINRIAVGDPVPAQSHIVVGTHYVQMGFMLGVKNAKGELLYEVNYSDDQQDAMEVDDLVIVNVGPRSASK